METTLQIKNMVCPRCIKVVREDLEKMGLEVIRVELGEATVRSHDGTINISDIKEVLEREGFELLEDKQAITIQHVKTAIIKLIYSDQIEEMKVKVSEYITEEVGKDYHHISMVFSAVEHITLERFFILRKIERAKELLSYNELSSGEISRKLGYSIIARFSNQFKQITGYSPLILKMRTDLKNRRPIDKGSNN